MLKHCSTLSLDTSRRSLRQDNRLSLYSPPPPEKGSSLTRERTSQGLSLTTLPRPRERPCGSLPREKTVIQCSRPVTQYCDRALSASIDSVPVNEPSAYSDRVAATSCDIDKCYSSSDSERSYSTAGSDKSYSTGGSEGIPPDRDVTKILPSTQTSVRAIKVYATCLRPHLSYKTVVITPHTTSKQVILGLLSRFRMRHRDPNLFHLTMEVTVELGDRQTILLEDNSRPAEMISCNPWAGCKFILQAKQGGLVRVYDHLVRPESVYKCLIISEDTTVGDTIGILRSCYREEEVWGLVALQTVIPS